MLPERLASVALAGCCLVALSMGATALQDTVRTEPDDVVDVDATLLPYGQGQVEELKRRVARPADAGQSGETREDADRPEDGPRTDPVPPDQGPDQPTPAAGSAAGDRESAASGASRPDEGGSGLAVVRSLLERLLDVLRELVLVASLVAALAVVVRYRERLAAVVRALLARLGFGWGRSDSDADHGAEPPRPSPGNDVVRAWCLMVGALDLEDRETRTPGECASAAVEAGADPDDVQTLRRAFEEVRYGGAPVTPARRRLAGTAGRRIDAVLGGGEA